MSGKLHKVTGQGEADVKPIADDRLIEGAPVTTTRLDYHGAGETYAGEWASDVGAWRVSYDEWEFCHVIEGVCELTPDGGSAHRFQTGDSFVIEPGFKGVWRVIEPMKKRFVVRYD